jgi:release factor glutamine methyltransferase
MSDIYEPAEDSYLLQRHVERLVRKGDLVLDVGTGSGIQAMTAAKKAEKVIASDINEDALRQAKLTAQISKIKNIEFIRSDLFWNIPRQRFDLIVFNPPYLPEEKGVEDEALFSGKRGVDTTLRFIDACPEYLADEGNVLITGSSIADNTKIRDACEARMLTIQEIDKEHYFFEDIFVFLIRKDERLKMLSSKGFSEVRRFSHGKRGTIYLSIFKGIKAAVKSKRPESKASLAIENEARFLKLLNAHGIGPVLLDVGDGYFAYRFAEGIFFLDYLTSCDRKHAASMIADLFGQCGKLDSLGINKFEMARPVKHVIVKDDGKPVLIDFERARFTENPKNVTQLCDFMMSEPVQDRLSRLMISYDKGAILDLAKAYRHSEPGARAGILGKIIRIFK